MRISFVLGGEGGVLPLMARMARWFVGGSMGSGRQFVSWIHQVDLTRAMVRAIEDDGMSGVYVVSSPEPARNAEFMAELRRAVGRPWSPRVPEWLVRAGCWLMRTEPVLALTGRRGDPRRLEEAGFTFRYPTLREALLDLLGDGQKREVGRGVAEAASLATKAR